MVNPLNANWYRSSWLIMRMVFLGESVRWIRFDDKLWDVPNQEIGFRGWELLLNIFLMASVTLDDETAERKEGRTMTAILGREGSVCLGTSFKKDLMVKFIFVICTYTGDL